jgi:Protein of unknown function (DUF3617)
MNVRRVAALAALAACSAVVFAQTPRRDGKWEVTTQIEMAGMPAGRGMPAMTTTQCITKEQAADPQKAVPQPPQRGGAQSDCKVSDFKTTGSKINWTIKCTTPQAVDGTGEVTYGTDTYEGLMTMNMQMARGGQTTPMQMTIKMNGKRLGDCEQ